MASKPKKLSVAKAVAKNRTGLTFGNRLILPFHAHLIWVRVAMHYSSAASGGAVISDLSPQSKAASATQTSYGTELYLFKYNDLKEEFGRHKARVLLQVVEIDADIFKLSAHKTLECTFRDDLPEVRFQLADEAK